MSKMKLLKVTSIKIWTWSQVQCSLMMFQCLRLWMYMGQGEFTANSTGRAELLFALRSTDSLAHTHVLTATVSLPAWEVKSRGFFPPNDKADIIAACLMRFWRCLNFPHISPDAFPRREAAADRSAAIFGPVWEWDLTALAPQLLEGWGF